MHMIRDLLYPTRKVELYILFFLYCDSDMDVAINVSLRMSLAYYI